MEKKGVSSQPFKSADLQLKKQNSFSIGVETGWGKSFDLPLNGIPADRHWGTNNTFDWGAVDVPGQLV